MNKEFTIKLQNLIFQALIEEIKNSSQEVAKEELNAVIATMRTGLINSQSYDFIVGLTTGMLLSKHPELASEFLNAINESPADTITPPVDLKKYN